VREQQAYLAERLLVEGFLQNRRCDWLRYYRINARHLELIRLTAHSRCWFA